MPRVVRGGLIQAAVGEDASQPLERLRKLMMDKHAALIEEAADMGVQVLCLQELSTGPYFPAEQDTRWYGMVEGVPDGPTVRTMQDLAKAHGMVMVVPVYEEEMAGVYYNTAAVLDSDGTYLGKYRKTHIPHLNPAWTNGRRRNGSGGGGRSE